MSNVVALETLQTAFVVGSPWGPAAPRQKICARAVSTGNRRTESRRVVGVNDGTDFGVCVGVIESQNPLFVCMCCAYFFVFGLHMSQLSKFQTIRLYKDEMASMKSKRPNYGWGMRWGCNQLVRSYTYIFFSYK